MAYRQNRNRVAEALVFMIDGDRLGVTGRMQQLAEECKECEIDMPQKGEKVAIFVPTWNIETWLAYLDRKAVDETERNYPRLRRQRECEQHVQMLAESCRSGELRQPAPKGCSVFGIGDRTACLAMRSGQCGEIRAPRLDARSAGWVQRPRIRGSRASRIPSPM